MGNVTQTIMLVFGIMIWLSLYLFMEVKITKLGELKRKPIVRSIFLFVYMYLGITAIRMLL